MDQDQVSILLYKIEDTAKKVDRIYQALFGIDGKGGLNKMVDDHEAQLKDLQQHKAKAIGVIAVLTLIGGAIGSKISSLWKP